MKVKLESFLQEVCEKTTVNDQYPVLTSSKAGLFLQSEYFNKQVASKDNIGYKVIHRGQFTYRAMSDTGEFYPNILDCVDVGIVSPAYPVFEISDKAVIEPEYLKYFFKSKGFQQSISAFAQGSTRTSIKFAKLKTVSIELPSIDRQKDIVSILDKAQFIVDKEIAEITKLDDLIKARFVEMFGEPISNPMKWERMTFKQAGMRLSDGPFGSNLKSEHYTNEGVRVIRLGNIGVGKFIDNDKSFVSYEHYKTIERYTCRAGEIVIGTLGEPNLRACIVPENVEFAINKADCVHYIPKAELLNNCFVCQYINCPETLLLASGMIHGQTRARISSGQIAELLIYTPPIELQEQFADFVVQVDKSKVAVQKALDEAQLLFDSLMQEYFG